MTSETAAWRSTLRRLLTFLALLASLVALATTLWIIFPAPLYNLWLLSVVASEWSLWFGAIGLFGALCALAARAFGGRLWRVALVSGATALVFAFVPLVSAMYATDEYGVRLSLREYAAGLWNDNPSDAPDLQTHTFANIEGNRLELDVYMPPASSAPNGAGIIIVHGGSWSAGERNDFPQWNRWLARQGYTIFDIDYRLTQPNWQTATSDVKCAVLWVKAHATEFSVNPSRLALMGRSAGGHLALLAAYTAGDARLPPSCAQESGALDASVRAVVSLYAPTDTLWAYDNPANRRVIDGPLTLRCFLGGSPYEGDELRERFRLASPIAHVNAQTPATLLIHGGRDQLVRKENMPRLVEALRQADVAHQTLLIPYAQHGFDYNFHGWGSQIVKPVLLRFFEETLAP
jgi:acetyl esterase/lipase